MSKKYLDLEGLSTYDQKIKEYIGNEDDAIEEQVTDLKSALAYFEGVEESASLASDWEQGQFATTTGDRASTSTRIRTKAQGLPVNVKFVEAINGYKFLIYCWSDTEYLGIWNGTTFTKISSSGLVITKCDLRKVYSAGAKYICVCLMRANANETIEPSEGVNLIYTIFGNDIETIKGRVDNIEDNVGNLEDDVANIEDNIDELNSAIDDLVSGYPESPQTYIVGHIGTNTGAKDDTNTKFIRTVDGTRSTIAKGDIIISDGTYGYRVGIYNSKYIAAAYFNSWLTPTNYSKNRTITAFPESLIGKYFVIDIYGDGETMTAEDAAAMSNHIKVIHAGYNKIGYERLLNNADDIDDIKDNGVYRWTTSSYPAHIPTNAAGVMIVAGTPSNTFTAQLIIYSNGKIKCRYNDNGSWNEWGPDTNTKSANMIDMASFKGDGNINVTYNEQGWVTIATKSNGAYRNLKVLKNAQSVLKPNTVYALRCKVEAISGSGNPPLCYYRFRGTYEGVNTLGIGIGAMTSPGEYGAFYRTTGFEQSLDFFVTGSTSASGSVTLSEIMLAETDLSMPHIPYDVSEDVILAATGAASSYRSVGRANALASANQYAHCLWTPVSDLVSQFDSIGYKFNAGVQVQGIPYSSARGVDKLIGPQITAYTFLTAVRNPRSVLYTRRTTYSNSKTYYGCVCSAYVSHNYRFNVNYTTANMRNWEKLKKIEYSEIQSGDIMVNPVHVIFITGVYHDKYGRIIGVGWSEAGEPTVKDTLALPWANFVRGKTEAGYIPYRYIDVDSVQYDKESGMIGYPDETLTEIAIPDIMSEYGDKAVLCKGEDVVINVLDGTGYDTITVKIDGTTSQTITTIADFTLSNLAPGHYTITMSGTGKESGTEFFVCDATCSYNSETHILTFESTNAHVAAIYTYTGLGTPDNPSRGFGNKLVIFTDADIEAGEIDLSNYITDVYQYAKIAFEPNDYPEWGVGTWYSASPESLGLWEANT